MKENDPSNTFNKLKRISFYEMSEIYGKWKWNLYPADNTAIEWTEQEYSDEFTGW